MTKFYAISKEEQEKIMGDWLWSCEMVCIECGMCQCNHISGDCLEGSASHSAADQFEKLFMYLRSKHGYKFGAMEIRSLM